MKIKFKKLLGKLHFKKDSKKQAMRPSRDWAITFFSFLSINLAIVAFLALVYFDMGRDDDSFELEGESRLLFKKDLFEERLNQYQDKVKNLDSLLSNGPETVDPSI